MATPSEEMKKQITWRRFEDGENEWDDWGDKIFLEDTSYKCPTYINRTPPCQGSCPSGHDIRGWLAIVREQEKPSEGMEWEQYAFERAVEANPFPSMMGRVCPAPCQDGCNRNEVEDFVGINSVEQYIGDTAIEKGFKFTPGADTGKKVAVIGGGPAGMAAAFQLRKTGHAVTVFEKDPELGGMMRYGIPNYRIPRDKLQAEIQRILDMGVETRTGVKVGVDVPVADIEKEHDAILWALGCQNGRDLPVDGWTGTPNCVSGVAFLKAFNEGRMKVTAKKVVCIGGGDTSIDVISVARRLGANSAAGNPEDVVLDTSLNQDDALTEGAEPAAATLTSLFTKDKMFAAQHEIHDALHEGCEILDGVMPLEVIIGDDGRATGLKVCDCTMDGMTPIPTEGTERILEADLIVSAIGQSADMEGLEEMANDKNLMDSDKFYQVPGKEGHFVAGDIIRPHLLTTAIGQASIACESIDAYLGKKELAKRPKVDVHHFDLLDKLKETDMEPETFDKNEGDLRGTNTAKFAVHNYEDRSYQEIIPAGDLFLGHFSFTPRLLRSEDVPTADEVLHHFKERMSGLNQEQAQDEAKRCMSCGMCFECDNCVVFCPQDAVFRVKKAESTTGRYVDTDYNKCIGCHVCTDVCPTGYIQMGLGE
ncbi:MAG: glutamate synthase [gamma proteobacterium symbiont of Ctena orbiculata]|uniref:NAD(P)-binding protein n=1 Tax=Candidatus Thiodiazotropha taylori TaxID=2792791 RepID=A0A944QU48_9GAMM|nr:NAD(P)-binding protein [Candidatus Thiodiazotropha taylori]PUB84456.1 MAG: glutamate synthase [gamma proteobacterium symbiont of Ctena orbiculata]MBT2988475.1 NAD(P)-binding protein [Candidatus Thiodiazotropha taylori]MBT2997381.1 NAD(P)-binding protein [Candidatus Thiodiazotropha taylori]MBT3000909.1 NAD(P)-binding protein [Candidatus Thiodiazotropha taylori]